MPLKFVCVLSLFIVPGWLVQVINSCTTVRTKFTKTGVSVRRDFVCVVFLCVKKNRNKFEFKICTVNWVYKLYVEIILKFLGVVMLGCFY